MFAVLFENCYFSHLDEKENNDRHRNQKNCICHP